MPTLEIADLQWSESQYGLQAFADGTVDGFTPKRSDKGTSYIETRVNVNGKHAYAKLWLTDKTRESTKETIYKVFGFQGTREQFAEFVRSGSWNGVAVSLTLGQHNYNGKISVEVKFLNPPREAGCEPGEIDWDMTTQPSPAAREGLSQIEQPTETPKGDDDLPF